MVISVSNEQTVSIFKADNSWYIQNNACYRNPGAQAATF